MEIKEIKIQNYRAIEEVSVLLNYSINPIIGVNESGKTTVLKAILALDKGRDRTDNGNHLDFQNKYSTRDTTDCRITAIVRLSQEEIENLKKYSRVSTNSEEFSQLEEISGSTNILFSRILSEDKKYLIENENFSDRLKDKIAKYILDHFPVFLYFDDFTDRVPENISFSEEYANDGKLSRSKQREWQEIIEEIFRRADLEGIDDDTFTLRKFLNISDRDRKLDILSDIEDVLNTEIIEEWKKIKQRGKNNYADDSEHLTIKLDNPEPTKFQFKVKDKSNENRRRTFNVNERSKGFQWFFNYMIKLKFNPRYKKTQENSIFLLDEPGSYLHSSAQSELLKELKSVSTKNTIIYCTHSQFLLNPDDIKLGSIKIAQKKESKIKVSLFGEYEFSKDSGALSPVYQALQLNYSHDFIGDVIITEGITDYYILKMTQEFWNSPKKDTNIIPGSGAGNLTTLISLALGFSSNFKVIFDNDRGTEAIAKYKDEFGESISRYFHIYHETESNFKLESHFSKKDKENLIEVTGSTSIKKAIPILFLDFPHQIESFLNNLEENSKKLLGVTINLAVLD